MLPIALAIATEYEQQANDRLATNGLFFPTQNYSIFDHVE
jgi:hypothetical protein